MPLWHKYQDVFKSDIADFANVGPRGESAGSGQKAESWVPMLTRLQIAGRHWTFANRMETHTLPKRFGFLRSCIFNIIGRVQLLLKIAYTSNSQLGEKPQFFKSKPNSLSTRRWIDFAWTIFT